MALPVWQATGTGSETSPAWPTHAADDWGLLWQTTNSGTPAVPTDWERIAIVTNAAGTAVLTLDKRKATSGAMGAPALSGGGTFLWGVITTVRGADLTTPDHQVATGFATSATTAGFAPGLRTYEADCLIIHGVGWAIDNAGPIASAWTNASITVITEQYDAGTITGDGGGISLADGDLATAGLVDPGTVTLTSTSFACLTVAIRPPRASSGGGVSLSRVVNS